MFFKKKSFNKPKPPVKKVTKKWEPTIDLSNIDKKKTDDDKSKYWYTPMYFSDIWVIRRF